MGQVCPASAPSQQYAPTNCQGVSNSVTNEKNKIQTSQPCVESRLISRGASCTQDDIRRSLRKEKEMHITSIRSTDTPDSNKDEERLHSKHRHSSRSLQNQSLERHQTSSGHDSMRRKSSKDEERAERSTSKHHRHRQKQDDALQVVRDEFEEFQRTRHQETQGGHQYHKTHVLHQKGTKLQVESQNVAKQQIQTHQHHHHHRHHHRKMDRAENEQVNTVVNRQDRQKTKLSSHGEYSSQNEHNAKISERRIHVPNNSQSARSSQKSHKERVNKMEAVSPRSSLRERHTKQNEGKDKNSKDGKKKSQRMRKLEDPVYSLPPLMQ